MSIDLWLNKTIKEPSVCGVIIIDDTTGLSLGSRGTADNDDAPQLKWMLDSKAADNSPNILTLKHRDSLVYIARENRIITAVYKPLARGGGEDGSNTAI